MSRAAVSKQVNGSGGLVAVPDIDLDSLTSELPGGAGPALSVEKDFDLDELVSRPDAQPVVAGPDFSSVLVRKPGALDFVYVHPEWRVNAYLVAPDRSRSQWNFTHLVVRAVAEQFSNLCRNVALMPYANKNKTLCLWPIPLENAMGSLSNYSDSALGAVREGAGKWCRYELDMEAQRYRVYSCPEDPGEPEWPAGGMKQLVNAAFRGHIITDAASEVLQKRVGQLIK